MEDKTKAPSLTQEQIKSMIQELAQLRYEKILTQESVFRAEVLNNQQRIINGINAILESLENSHASEESEDDDSEADESDEDEEEPVEPYIPAVKKAVGRPAIKR